MARRIVWCGIVYSVLSAGGLHKSRAETPTGAQLPDTQPLQLADPLDVVMVRGINRFAERELAASRARRTDRWSRDDSTDAAYLNSIEPHRQRLREMIGAVEAGPAPAPNVSSRLHPSGQAIPGLVVMELRWDVCEGVEGVGLQLIPATGADAAGKSFTVMPGVILLPDAQQTVESAAGLMNVPGLPAVGRRLAESGCNVLIVSLLNRRDDHSGHPDIRRTNIPHRELVYRCGFDLGRHPAGYETLTAMQARRALNAASGRDPDDNGPFPSAICGIGDGAMIAQYAAALDPEFDAAYVAGYFDERESIWQQPLDRNVFGLLTEFGDAELAGMIAPRPLVIDNAPPPGWDGPPAPRDGRTAAAAPGRITAPDPASVQAEFERAKVHYEQLRHGDRIQLIPRQSDGKEPISDIGLTAFLKALGINDLAPPGPPIESPPDGAARDAARQKRLVESLIRHTQMILHRSDKVREKFWSNADGSSVAKWAETSQSYRDYVHDHLIGRLPPLTAPLNPRSRKIIDEPTHTGWEVVLDVYPEESSVEGPVSGVESPEQAAAAAAPDAGHSTLDSSVIAGGILLLPKDLKPGERRPVVVCQHGLEGTPMDTITTDQTTRAWAAYKGFSTQLVQRGLIVYAPQNPYKGGDEFRIIQRKSNPLGRSLFSYIIEQHRQTLRWLATLPYVAPERIAFYGLSYGGKTAVRVPPLLMSPGSSVQSPPPGSPEATLNAPRSALDHPGYCLSICSADFNEWIRKNASAEDRYSYVYTGEYEIFEWNMGHIAGYAELSSLLAPRPFMVERGHGDGVAPDEWVGWEFAKVRRHYDRLGLGDRAEIEWFNGPHTIHGQGTFRFLHRHLRWTE